jgi:hypothetical protein
MSTLGEPFDTAGRAVPVFRPRRCNYLLVISGYLLKTESERFWIFIEIIYWTPFDGAPTLQIHCIIAGHVPPAVSISVIS